MNNHWYNEGKEILNQGRSKKQLESSYFGAAFGIVGVVLILVILITLNIINE